MAVVNYALEQVNPGAVVVTWPSLHNGDTGEPFVVLGYKPGSIIVSGTLGSGGDYNISVSGSINNPAYIVNSSSSALPSELTYPTTSAALLRPAVTAGDGTTSISFSLVLSNYTG